MIPTRTPVTASCPRCRSSNSIDLADLLSRSALTIRCQRCDAEYPIRLQPGLPAARPTGVCDPTPPPLTALTWPSEPAKREEPAPSDGTPGAEGWIAGGWKALRAVAAAVFPSSGPGGRAA